MKHIAVIYDRDPLYAVKLAGYLNTFEGFPFDTRAFSTENGVETFCVNETVDIAMIDENSLYMVDRLVFKELVVLSTDCSRQNNGTLYVYKYQNGAKILKELMRYLAESDKIGSLITRKNEMRIISFFSPVKRVMATTMAIGMGQILGKTKKTLYLNLECFSGLEQILGKPFANDIGDLMYHIESRGTNIGATIAGIAENFDGLDVIPSVKNHNDLLSIASEIWKNLLLHIEQDTDYEYPEQRRKR